MQEATYYNWADIPQTDMGPAVKRRLISGEKLMVVEMQLEKGATVKEHQHPHEQITHIVSGAVEFDVRGEKKIVQAGQAIYVPSNLPHAAVVLEDTVTLEIFSPPREDFLSGEPSVYAQ